jgi:hypothetical protein
MIDRKGEPVFSGNIDEILTEKIIRHSTDNIHNDPEPNDPTSIPRRRSGMPAIVVFAALVLAFSAIALIAGRHRCNSDCCRKNRR